MASQLTLRAGMRSPVHAFMKPALTRSILKKPAPLALSPNSLPFAAAASFSIVVNSPRPSPHVHFPSSPAIAVTFTAYSPNTYDRGPITISPESPGLSGWANRQLSPTAYNAFKLLDPPKSKGRTQNAQLLTVPVFEDPRSPKPYKEERRTTQRTQLLAVPTIQDPRSPKPYKSVSFQELTLHVPRGDRSVEELGKALSTYPRSPYPSAPIEEDTDRDTDMDIDSPQTSARGRGPSKIGKPQPPPRARSLEREPKSRHRANLAAIQHVASPLRQSFLTPVTEGVSANAKPTSVPVPLDLETQFWESVTLEEESEPESAYVTANESVSVSSPVPNIMFGNMDGQLWSPRITRKKDVRRDRVLGVDIGPALSPAQRRGPLLRKGMVASPSPNDPLAAFPSFTMAMMEGSITAPPRARVVQEM